MNIDYSKFLFKCENDDCLINKDSSRCCISCELFKECSQKGKLCIYLDEHDNNPEDCPELYLKKE